tara:strand:+ start:1417 stop:1665 length:249 start_codon:yes stop_codon:yes gene_type:complete
MTAQYMWLLVFGVILYVIVVDPNVARAFDYVLKLVNTNIRRELWWLKNNPANPVVKYIMYRKNLKLAKELREKINKHLEAKE